MIEACRLIGAGMTCVVTNAAHIVLCSCSLFFTLSLSWLFPLLPDARPSPPLPIFITLHSFSFSTFFSPIPLLPPISHTLSSLHDPLTSFINISVLTPFSSRLPIRHSPFTCFSFHFLFASFDTHSFTHYFLYPPTPRLHWCLFGFSSSPRWTGRWTSSSRTAAWTSTTACSRSCCSSNTWCGASERSGSTSSGQVRRRELLIQAGLRLLLWEKRVKILPVVLRLFIKYSSRGMLWFLYVLLILSTSRTSGIVVKQCASVG